MRHGGRPAEGPDRSRPEAAHAPPEGAEEGTEGPESGWRKALRWAERALWAGILIFAAVRLGPQLGALTGIGPALGSAPAFSVETLDGAVVTPELLEDRVVVVNFWATWCPPCRLEIPALQKLHEEFGADGLVVVGLSTDVGGTQKVRDFLGERGVTYAVAMATPQIRRAFGGVSALPTTFVLDRDGVIRHRVLGFFAPPAMRAAVRRLMES
ncbi:MAG: TlpA family protein disulfide reductase [Gemmatimonadales bacterium]|jgi:thiol-disulfide isomerase/thioredoxin|nr:MAG: TlpA family protein disulfide reductase [Gemmatimonadales bacterium]